LPVDAVAGTLPAMKKDPFRPLRSAWGPAGMRAAQVAGFTVLELMITIAVLGILLGIGVPSFNNIVRQNRIASQTNELLAAAAMARSEAVKRGTEVVLCPVDPDDPDMCSGEANWNDGWMIFADEEGDENDVIIQRWPRPGERRMTVESSDDLDSITYRGDGSTTLGVGRKTEFIVAPVPEYCQDPEGARIVTIAATGRVNATRTDCPRGD
jgi:prepilin-type N-terminal cleavage/methylation domain-containing protein